MEQALQIQQEETADGGAFFVMADDDRVAEILWTQLDDRTIDVHRTFTDPSLRGQGVARKLVVRLAEFAIEQKLRIQPSCSYAEKVLSTTEQYQPLIAKPSAS